VWLPELLPWPRRRGTRSQLQTEGEEKRKSADGQQRKRKRKGEEEKRADGIRRGEG